MAITRWEPFGMLTSLERDMHELLDRLNVRPVTEGFAWKPATDVVRENGTLVVRTELPGIDPEKELTIDVEDNVLHIVGEKTTEHKIEDEHRYLRERRFGSFRRELLLPEGVDPETVTATYDGGVLTIEVPLRADSDEEPARVTVPVTHKG